MHCRQVFSSLSAGKTVVGDVGWAMEGCRCPDVHRDLLQREYGQTKVFDRADSTVREILATHGGYFSTEVHCHANTTESSFLARTTRIRPRAIPHFLGVEGR